MTEREQQRLVKHRLAVLQHAEEVTRQRRSDLPLLRDQPADLLRVATPLRGEGARGPERPLQTAPLQP